MEATLGELRSPTRRFAYRLTRKIHIGHGRCSESMQWSESYLAKMTAPLKDPNPLEGALTRAGVFNASLSLPLINQRASKPAAAPAWPVDDHYCP
jgi:hypothetical protein